MFIGAKNISNQSYKKVIKNKFYVQYIQDLESFTMHCWRRMENSWSDRVRHEVLQKSQGRKECPTYSKKKES
jgi:hypothetical protein